MITPTSHRGPDGHWAWDQPHRSMARGGGTITYSHTGDTACSPLDPHGISGDCLEGASPPKPIGLGGMLTTGRAHGQRKGPREKCWHQMGLRRREETQVAVTPTNARHYLGKEETGGRKE